MEHLQTINAIDFDLATPDPISAPMFEFIASGSVATPHLIEEYKGCKWFYKYI